MTMGNLATIIEILREECRKFKNPIVTLISKEKSPFKVLISCLLSLRTKDAVTAEASRKLFEIADTPEKLSGLNVKKIEKLIYPVGFYHTKAKRIKDISKVLVEKYDSRVPDTIDELLKLHGVGRKTANLVVGLGYGIPSICVDTHVHRLSNRLGLVKTKNPHETEFALRKLLPEKHWIEINDYMVSYGQNICVPVSPWCSKCRLRRYCKRVGVERSR